MADVDSGRNTINPALYGELRVESVGDDVCVVAHDRAYVIDPVAAALLGRELLDASQHATVQD